MAGDHQAALSWHQHCLLGISQLCAGERASLSPTDRAEMPFMARLFLPFVLLPKLLPGDTGRDFKSCLESAPSEVTGRLSLDILYGAAPRFQHVPDPAWPSARAELFYL